MNGRRLWALLFPSLLLLHAFAAAENPRRFRMYRNPPKPRLAVMPVLAPHLDAAARKTAQAALERAAAGSRSFQALPWPDSAAADSLGGLSSDALAALRGKPRIEVVLRARLVVAGAGHSLELAMLDTRDGSTRAETREDCRCPLPELLGESLDGALKRLADAPRLRNMRCQEGMAVIPSQSPPAAETQSGGEVGPGAFCIDLFEYPNQRAGEPVVGKDWTQAGDLCARAGKRLCTESEWELACGGWPGAAYPYGAAYDSLQCNTSSVTILLSGRNEGCRSPFGVHDLSGNVYEWTASSWSVKYRDKVVKGGNWNSGAENSTCQARFGQPATTASKAIGFRCCMTLSR